MDIATLIKDARRGNAAAEKCLFDVYAGRMLVVCRRYVKQPEDAEERLLDGFCNFFKALRLFRYESDAATAAFIKKIMVNECLMFLRKKNVFTISTGAGAAEPALPEAALDNMSAAEIFQLIICLPVGYRTVFNLYEVEGVPHKEIAALLGITEGTSRSQLSKAKILLQKMVLNNAGYAKQQEQ